MTRRCSISDSIGSDNINCEDTVSCQAALGSAGCISLTWRAIRFLLPWHANQVTRAAALPSGSWLAARAPIGKVDGFGRGGGWGGQEIRGARPEWPPIPEGEARSNTGKPPTFSAHGLAVDASVRPHASFPRTVGRVSASAWTRLALPRRGGGERGGEVTRFCDALASRKPHWGSAIPADEPPWGLSAAPRVRVGGGPGTDPGVHSVQIPYVLKKVLILIREVLAWQVDGEEILRRCVRPCSRTLESPHTSKAKETIARFEG